MSWVELIYDDMGRVDLRWEDLRWDKLKRVNLNRKWVDLRWVDDLKKINWSKIEKNSRWNVNLKFKSYLSLINKVDDDFPPFVGLIAADIDSPQFSSEK